MGGLRDLLDIVGDLLQSRVIIEGAVGPPNQTLLPEFDTHAHLRGGNRVVDRQQNETEEEEQPSCREHGDK